MRLIELFIERVNYLYFIINTFQYTSTSIHSCQLLTFALFEYSMVVSCKLIVYHNYHNILLPAGHTSPSTGRSSGLSPSTSTWMASSTSRRKNRPRELQERPPEETTRPMPGTRKCWSCESKLASTE